jgi:tetratricopeptide (TPR) repeat protein
MDDGTDGFDDFIRTQWREHADHTEAVAQRLAESMTRIRTAARVAPYAGLVVHVYGVHLAQWARGAEVLQMLRRAPGFDASPAAEGPVQRGLAALALASGDEAAADALELPDRIVALAQASSALLDREELDRAIALFDQALALAPGAMLADDAPAVRSLAVGGNNLAATLEDRPGRSPAQTAAMLRAAQAGLVHWERCGGWLEQERAAYRLARSQLRAGRPADALAAAHRCLQICASNQAPAFECVFGHAMEALGLAGTGASKAARAAGERAMAAYARVPADDQPWCADDLKEMQAALAILPPSPGRVS